MYGSRVTLICDLQQKVTKPHQRAIVEDLRTALADDEIKTYNTAVCSWNIKSLGGSVVRIGCFNWDGASLPWNIFQGLKTLLVLVEDGGSEHFPPAGLYDSESLRRPDLKGVSAIVRWVASTSYPVREDFPESVIRASMEDHALDLRLEVPVVVSRNWSMALMAPNLRRAQLGYQEIRGGAWTPSTPFQDSLPDIKKIRQVPVRFEPGRYE